ncbi:MAG: Spy/CpxP family protein refolding chaperone [Candidatus Syntrophosphaera sp.]
MKKLILIGITLIMLIGLTYAQAKDQEPTTNPRLKPRLVDDGSGWDRVKEMNFTDAQIKNLEDIRVDHMKNMNTLDAEIRNIEVDFDQAIKNKEFAKAKQLNQQLYEKRIVRSNARIDQMQRVMNELTEEQKEKCTPGFLQMMGAGNRFGYMGMHRDRHPGMFGREAGGSHPMEIYRNVRRMREKIRDCEDCDGERELKMDGTGPNKKK